MRRGNVIAAIVVVGVIGLVVAYRLGEPEGARTAGAGAGDITVVAQGPAADAALPDPGEVRVYSIDADESEVYWRIYRAGAMARLGHNHVISMGRLEGSIRVGSDLTAAEWELSFPVDGLIVDDPELRVRYGEEFESVPSERDKAGTKENMLSDKLLDGAVFPEIRLHGTGMTGSLDDARLPVSIEMLGRTIEQTFPATISIGAGSVTVTGEYRLTHEDLGLEPFTALAGMMAVGKDIDFTYRIHAVAAGR